MVHAIRTWSAVCSEAPYTQSGEGAGVHFCMKKWNRPTPVRRRLSLTQAARGKLIPTGLALVLGMKTRVWKYSHSNPRSILMFVHSEARMPSHAKLFKRFRAAGKNKRLDLILFDEHQRTHLKDHTRYDQGPEIYGKPRKVSLPVGEAQLAGCLRLWVGGPLE